MMFALVRLGWPNTAAILALAILPVVALTTVSDRGIGPARAQPIEAAAFCPAAAGSAVILAAAATEAVLE